MYSDDFYNQEIQSNIKLLNSNKKKKRKLAEKNLLELKGRLKSELRAAQNRINKILNNPTPIRAARTRNNHRSQPQQRR